MVASAWAGISLPSMVFASCRRMLVERLSSIQRPAAVVGTMLADLVPACAPNLHDNLPSSNLSLWRG